MLASVACKILLVIFLDIPLKYSFIFLPMMICYGVHHYIHTNKEK